MDEVAALLPGDGATAASTPSHHDVRSTRRALIELSKPGITRLVLVTTGLGVVAAPGEFSFADMAATLIGTALVVAGANALNMFLERDSDQFMTRTRGRPLPTGRLSPEAGLTFGVGVSILGLVLLALTVSTAAVVLAALALLSYVLVYTPMKRLSWLSLPVGAVPGALPPAIGYAALTGTVDGVGLWLFLVLLVWQLPHFLAISLFRQGEYENAGLKVMPSQHGVMATKAMALALSLVLLATSLGPYFFGLSGMGYMAVVTTVGVAYAGWAVRGFFPGAGDRWARILFFASMPHLVVIMTALVISAET